VVLLSLSSSRSAFDSFSRLSELRGGFFICLPGNKIQRLTLCLKSSDSRIRKKELKMETKLYVGNLSYDTTEAGLRTAFEQSGTVTEVAMIKDRDTGRMKGFAFVTMSSAEEAQKAIQALDGKSMDGRDLKVNIAKPREEGARRPSFGGSRRY
jgi:RNA recognition motif-containing protein